MIGASKHNRPQRTTESEPATAIEQHAGHRLRRMFALTTLTATLAGAVLTAGAGSAEALPVGGGGDGTCPAGYVMDRFGHCHALPTVTTPTSVDATNIQANGATITWTDTTGDESAFTVVRTESTTSGTAHSTVLPTVAVSPGQTSFSVADYGAAPNETVTWDVIATRPNYQDSAWVRTGVLTVPLPANASAAARAFQRDWSGSAFPYINRAAVLADALRIVADPVHGVYQGQTGGCGPATAEFELARRNPDRFVQILQSLVDNGSFSSNNVTYSASSDLRNSGAAPSASPANWLFLATLRDAGNVFMRITGSTPGDSPAWISMPGEVDNWMANIVGLPNTTATALVWPFTTGQGVMPVAANLLAGGKVVVLLVDSSILGNPPGMINTPNHYIDLTSFSSTATTVSFTAESWGSTYTVSNMSWDRFNALTFDVLTAS